MYEDRKEVFSKRHSKYRRKCKLEGHYGLRTGYYEGGQSSPGESIRRMREEVANQTNISSGDHVVDIGCGFGDCLVWLAQEKGVSGSGIDIAPPQLDVARELAADRGVDDQIQFVEGDFHELSGHVTSPVDVVWACEALMFTDRTQEVVEQMSEALNDSGRIVIADMFVKQESLSGFQREHLRTIFEGNRSHFDRIADLREQLSENGFVDITEREVTEMVRPEIRRNGKFARLYHPLFRVGKLFRVVSQQKVGTIGGAISTAKLVAQGVIGYYIISARAGRRY